LNSFCRFQFESIATLTAAESYFVDVPLIDGENLTDLRSASAVNKTKALPCQHRAGEKEGAAYATLATFSPAEKKLSALVTLPEMNQVKPPEFASNLNQET
jgi:hypothetical protein